MDAYGFIQEDESTVCLNVLEELATRGRQQCEGHCIRRRDQCIAYSFHQGMCRLIKSLHCNEEGEEIFKRSDPTRLFRKLQGNCKGGSILKEYYDSSVPSCGTLCHRNKNCKGFTFVSGEKKCVLKGSTCPDPELYNYNVIFWEHKLRLV